MNGVIGVTTVDSVVPTESGVSGDVGLKNDADIDGGNVNKPASPEGR